MFKMRKSHGEVTPKLVLLFLLVLGGCATPNPFDVPPTQAATLRNFYEQRGPDRISFLFRWLDGVVLNPGPVTAEAAAEYQAPAGQRYVVVYVSYARHKKGAYETEVPLLASIKPGHHYIANATFEENEATIWIEDQSTREIVSEKAKGRLDRMKKIVPILIPVPIK